MAYGITASFDLFPQHCSLPEFTPPEHAAEVCTELVESIGKLNKKDKKQILKQMATALKKLATNTNGPIQRVNRAPTLEGGATIQRVSTSPLVTTSTNPTAPATYKATPRTYMRSTRNNTPGAVPAQY